MQRPGDLAARYGGEEYVILLPDTQEAGALQIAESLRDAVASLNLAHEVSAAKKVTISIGYCAMIPSGELHPAMLIKGADLALYAAKNSGRNCVKSWLDGVQNSATLQPAGIL